MTEDRSILALVRAPHFTWKGYGLTCGVLFVVFVLIFIPVFVFDSSSGTEPLSIKILIALSGSLFSALIYGSMGYFIVLGIRKVTFNSDKVEHLTKSSEELQGALNEDFVTNLVRINFKYIDAYYLQTRIQADKSFNFTMFAAVVSLLLIIAGIAMSFFGTANSATDPTKTAATISAGAGVLGEFISAVFFYLYNQTVAKMADYHRKLVFTQNIGLALKISDGLPADEKTKAQIALINTLSTDINQHLAA